MLFGRGRSASPTSRRATTSRSRSSRSRSAASVRRRRQAGHPAEGARRRARAAPLRLSSRAARRSSSAPSSASTRATSSSSRAASKAEAAPLRHDPEGEPAHRRSRARLHRRGRPDPARAADHPVALGARLHDGALQAGSPRDGPGLARDQVVRPRPGLAGQDRRRLARPPGRPDRHLRRRSRQQSQRGDQRARRRARRHRACGRKIRPNL